MLNLKSENSDLRKGFTLVELLVVISILAILAGLLITNVSGVRGRARDSQRKNDLRQIKEALRMYYNNNNTTYPVTGTGGTITGCGTDASPAVCNWGSVFTKNSITYMMVLPKDPLFDNSWPNYVYTYISRDNFKMYATLENKSDKDSTKSQTNCGLTPTPGVYYVCAD